MVQMIVLARCMHDFDVLRCAQQLGSRASAEDLPTSGTCGCHQGGVLGMQ